MTLHLIADARRDLRAITERAEHGCLSPEGLKYLVARLDGRLDDIEAMLDHAGPAALGPRLAFARRIVRGLGVIEGGRP
ncbi:MAG: hypothetical protein ACR2F8_02910 [Caulobacteraceae bacterium]